MLKRYQVLLEDWMEDYVKFIAEKYDLSSSAAIRVHLSLSILYVISILHPEYEPVLSDKELQEVSKKAAENELDEAEVHKMLSKVLFESRKAVEYILSKREKSIKRQY